MMDHLLHAVGRVVSWHGVRLEFADMDLRKFGDCLPWITILVDGLDCCFSVAFACMLICSYCVCDCMLVGIEWYGILQTGSKFR
jgi:hypothetical protein